MQRSVAEPWVMEMPDVLRAMQVQAAIGLCLFLVLGAVYLPGVNTVLNLVQPGLAGWSLIISMSLMPLMLGPLARKFATGVI